MPLKNFFSYQELLITSLPFVRRLTFLKYSFRYICGLKKNLKKSD
jgi:hypothetical protein